MDDRERLNEIFNDIDGMLGGLVDDPVYQSLKPRMKPRYFHRDGTAITSNELMPDFLQWALYFETADRRVAQDKTLYGERLSTVFLGMDHSFNFHPDATPILFETMLFAPRDREARRARLAQAAADIQEKGWEALNYETTEEDKRIDKKFPHDQLQLRYATEREAKDKHELLKLQCLIPPRWRRFLLYTIGEDATWA
jgi:hypothetical protein